MSTTIRFCSIRWRSAAICLCIAPPFTSTKGRKLHASGLYGANAKGGITGCFITTTDIITNQVLRKTTEPINKEFANIHKVNLKKFRDTNIPKKLIRGVMDVEPTQVLTREDGNVFLVGEITRKNKEVPSGQKPDNFPDEKVKSQPMQGVIVVNFNARGHRLATLSLNQMTVNDEGNGNSFVRGVLRDKIALLYNDNPVNVDQIDPVKQLPMERTGGKYSRGLIAYVDKYGKTDAEVLFTEKEEESILHPYSAYSIARNQQLVLATSVKGTLKLVSYILLSAPKRKTRRHPFGFFYGVLVPLFRSSESAGYVPVDNIPEARDVVGAAVLELEVVSMFPNVEAQDWSAVTTGHYVHEWIIWFGVLHTFKAPFSTHNQAHPEPKRVAPA